MFYWFCCSGKSLHNCEGEVQLNLKASRGPDLSTWSADHCLLPRGTIVALKTEKQLGAVTLSKGGRGKAYQLEERASVYNIPGMPSSWRAIWGGKRVMR